MLYHALPIQGLEEFTSGAPLDGFAPAGVVARPAGPSLGSVLLAKFATRLPAALRSFGCLALNVP